MCCNGITSNVELEKRILKLENFAVNLLFLLSEASFDSKDSNYDKI
jgi:hypothetical protein